MACHVSETFVRTHKLAITKDPVSVEVANGALLTSPGYVRAKLKLQGYCEEIKLLVTPLPLGVDVLLGDQWSRKEQVIADYGSDHTANHPPNMWLGKKRVRWVVQKEVPFAQKTPATVITAVQAKRLLAAPRTGCTPAFLVQVREVQTESSDANLVNCEDAQSSLRQLLDEFSDVFKEPTVTEAQHDAPQCIKVPSDATPPNRPSFRLSLKERQEVETQVKELLQQGRIVPSSSSYGAPVLFVPKPDGSLRMCIDYRALNKLTVKNKYPLPRIDDLMDNLGGAKCFSSMDLTSGYHQLLLNPEDCAKTAFNTHIGKYEWKVLPFGLSNAPAVFQAVMNKLFGKALNKFVCVYLDDILVFSKTPEEHIEHLRWVLEKLRSTGLKAKLAKCHFFCAKLKFLGHEVSAQGLGPDPAKVDTITNWPVPSSTFELRSFLGLTNYFRRYIKGYAKIASPLTDLLQGHSKADHKGKRLQQGKLPEAEASKLQAEFRKDWTPACDAAFHELKQALVTAPVLVLPDFERDFVVVVDACDHSIGGLLMQEGRPVAYYSRKLHGPEANYSASDREMLAVIAALREWRCYLEGRPFVIETDHQPNTYLDSAPPSAHSLRRRARWLSETSGFEYTWKYRPGAQNVADPVSRAPQHLMVLRLCAVAHSPDGGGDAQGRIMNSNISAQATDLETDIESDVDNERDASQVMAQAGVQTEVLDQVGRFAIAGFTDRVKSLSAKAQLDAHLREKLTLDRQGLYWTKDHTLWVPPDAQLRHDCIEVVHSHPYAGHYGVRLTHHLLQRAFFWPGMLNDVKAFIAACDSCQRVKAPRQKKYGKLHPLQIPDRRWDSVSLDLITDLPPTPSGHDSIVVFVDRLSKMVHVEPCKKTITSEGLAKLFESRVIRYHGAPSTIISDRDPRFKGVWQGMLEQWNIKHCMSTARHPETDGQTENANGVLEDTLRHFVGPYQSNWDDLIPIAEFAMNNAVNASTGFTPFMLNFGQNPNTPISKVLRSLNPNLDRFRGRWAEQLAHARKSLMDAQQRQKAQADKRRRPEPELKPGDQVLVHIKYFPSLQKGLKLKLAPRFLGPFPVLECIGPGHLSYRVGLPPPLHRVHNVFHVSALRIYKGNGSYQPPQIPPVDSESEVEFRADYVSDTKGTGSRRQYLVHWVGGGSTWELSVLLKGAEGAIRSYWESQGRAVPSDGLPWSTDQLASVLAGDQPLP